MSNPFGSPSDENDNFEVDLPEADSGGSDFSIPAGDYPARVIDLDHQTSKAGNPMWVWTFGICKGEHEGKEFRTYTALSAAAMWKLNEVVVALGLGKPGSRAKFTKQEAIGKYATISLEDDEYNGVKRSSITKVMPAKAGDEAPF